MKFKDFVHNSNLENKAKSNRKIRQVLSSLYLIDIKIYLRDCPFLTDVNLLPYKGTH